jgi:threonine dehydratase
VGAQVFLKFENLQFTSSFKERGACNKLVDLSENGVRGVIAMSAGNHAQGVAYHAQRLGLRALIVMPRFTPGVKIERTRGFGAEVVLHGDTLDAARAHALALAEQGAWPSSTPTTTRRSSPGRAPWPSRCWRWRRGSMPWWCRSGAGA